MIRTHHTLTSIGFVGRVTYTVTRSIRISFSCTIESSDGEGLFFFSFFLYQRYTVQPPSPWFPYSRIFSPCGFRAAFTPLVSPYSFSDIKLITTYENEFIFSDLTAFYLTISFENICTLKRGTSSRIQIIVIFI